MWGNDTQIASLHLCGAPCYLQQPRQVHAELLLASPCRFFPLMMLLPCSLHLNSNWLITGKERRTHEVKGSWLRQVGRGRTADSKLGEKKKTNQNLDSANIIHESQCEKPFTTQLPEGLRIVAECYVWITFPSRRTVVSFTETPPAQRSRSAFEWM